MQKYASLATSSCVSAVLAGLLTLPACSSEGQNAGPAGGDTTTSSAIDTTATTTGSQSSTGGVTSAPGPTPSHTTSSSGPTGPTGATGETGSNQTFEPAPTTSAPPTSVSSQSETPTSVPTSDAEASSSDDATTSEPGATSAEETDAQSTESGGPRTLGYLGCSMTDNVADGYNQLGFDRMWPSIPAYWGQVVQAWADNNSSVWSAFEQQVTMHGIPEAVWVMVCIFNPPGVQLDEMKQIIANVRERAPGVKIYITGQPFYQAGADCSIAGQGGPQLTDDMAKMVADDPSIGNVVYSGQLGPLSAAQKADACHANEAGKQLLGQQAAEMFGE